MGTAIVATSLNPYGRFSHQLRCFRQWKRLGFTPVSFNVDNEADDLRASRVEPELIKRIGPSESGKRLFGKPVPRIMPVLQWLVREKSEVPVVLTNSDIYPAIRSISVLRYWNSCAPALAMTREECPAIDSHEFFPENPYRGGLDTFFFSPEALERICRALESIPVAERMAFGVPGWDYLMAASVLRHENGGKILDGRILLHESHVQTYSDISEFSNYVEPLRAQGFVSDHRFEKAAEEFADRIKSECIVNCDHSRMAWLLYYDRPTSARPKADMPEKVAAFVDRLGSIAPQIQDAYSAGTIGAIVEKLLDGEAIEPLLQSSADSRSIFFQYAQTLFLAVLALECRSLSTRFALSEDYPQNNRHAEAIAYLSNKFASSPEAMRAELARLFATELLDYRIFNRKIFNYLAFSCENDSERNLLAEIRKHVLEKLNAPSAT